MTCYCDFEGPTIFNEQWPIAAKEHRCCECGAVIHIGDLYQRIDGLWDGYWDSYKTCEPCADLRESLTDVMCPTYGNLKDDYAEYLIESGFPLRHNHLCKWD